MDQLNIFVSHGTKYTDIANSLKRSLLRVRSRRQLSVKLSEDMPAGREWRKWIDDNVRTARTCSCCFVRTAAWTWAGATTSKVASTKETTTSYASGTVIFQNHRRCSSRTNLSRATTRVS